MESKLLTKRFLKDYKPHLSNGNESVRFYNNEFFLKIINSQILKNGRKDIILKLEELEHKDAATPEFLLHDKKGLLGYGTKNYLDYDYIDVLLNNNNLSLEDRKNLMIKLARIIEYFNSKNFAYYDIHSKNILYKDGDIKLIDLDGGVFKGYKNNNTPYEGAYRYSNFKLSLFALSFIYQMDDYDFYYLLNSNKQLTTDFLKSLPNELKTFYEHVINDAYKFNIIENIPELIDKIDYSTYEHTSHILRLK